MAVVEGLQDCQVLQSCNATVQSAWRSRPAKYYSGLLLQADCTTALHKAGRHTGLLCSTTAVVQSWSSRPDVSHKYRKVLYCTGPLGEVQYSRRCRYLTVPY